MSAPTPRDPAVTVAEIYRAVFGPPQPGDVLCTCGAIAAGMDDECNCVSTPDENPS